jgi:pimeloyl-ACP methyl ester carboxylesterase
MKKWLPLALALGLTGCGTQPIAPQVNSAAALITTTTIGHQPATIATPKRRTHRVVLFVHGFGSDDRLPFWHFGLADITAALLRDGFTVAASRAGGDNWGSASSVRDYLRLIDRLRAEGLTRLYVLAQSMGGLDGFELLQHIRPVAFVALAPVCDTGTLHDPAFHASLAAAGALIGRVPVRNVKGLRMLIVSSPQDTTVPAAGNAAVCAGEARAAGARVTVARYHGPHGDPSQYRPAQILREFG